SRRGATAPRRAAGHSRGQREHPRAEARRRATAAPYRQRPFACAESHSESLTDGRGERPGATPSPTTPPRRPAPLVTKPAEWREGQRPQAVHRGEERTESSLPRSETPEAAHPNLDLGRCRRRRPSASREKLP